MENEENVINALVGDGGLNQANGHVAVNGIAGHGFFNHGGGEIQANNGGQNPANGQMAVNGNFNLGGFQANNPIVVAGHGFFNHAGGIQANQGGDAGEGEVLGNPAIAGNAIVAAQNPAVGIGEIAGNLELPANAINSRNALVAFAGNILAATDRITAGLQTIEVLDNPAQERVGQMHDVLVQITALQAQMTQNLDQFSQDRVNTTRVIVSDIWFLPTQLQAVALLLHAGDGTVEIHEGLVQLMTTIVDIQGVLADYLNNVANEMVNHLVEPEPLFWEDENEEAEDAEVGEEAEVAEVGEEAEDAEVEEVAEVAEVGEEAEDANEGQEAQGGGVNILHDAQAENIIVDVAVQDADVAEGGEIAIGQVANAMVGGADQGAVVAGGADQDAGVAGGAVQDADVAGGQGVDIVFGNEQQPYMDDNNHR